MSTAPRVDDRSYPWKRNSTEANGNFEPAPPPREQNNNEQEKPPPPPRPPPPDSGKPYEQYEFQPRPSEAKPKRSNGFFYAVFGTRQLAEEDGREAYIRVTIRELLIYIVYLAIACILTLGTTSSSSYYFTKVMMDLFVDQQIRPDTKSFMTFRDSITLDDFWDYVEGPMLDNLYHQFLYKDGVDRSSPPATTPQVTTNGILFENRLIGVPRLRQIRVKPDSCEISPRFRRLIRQCYAEYSQDAEDTTQHWRPLPGSAWTYFTERQLYGSSHWGKFATYSGGGSYLDLRIDAEPSAPIPGSSPKPNAKEITREDIKILKKKHWITRATRVIFLDFSVYNANTNLFCFVKLVWEVPPTGGVITSWDIETANLLRYNNWYDLYIIFPCEILFCIFTFYYLIQEFYEMCYEGCKRYLKDIWSYVDISILIFSFICIAFSIIRYVVVQKEIEKLRLHKGVFYPMQKVAFWQFLNQTCVAILLFIAWIKLFKYMAFNSTMAQLSATLSRCAADVGGFAIMFSIVFAAFAQLGYLMFGAQVRDFSTFMDSVFTLLRLILGDFDFRQIEAANRILGPIYFIAYIFFVFFVLLNMFLAIINDTFGEVKAELQARGHDFEISDYFKRGFNNMCGWFGRKNEAMDAKYAVQLASADGVITYDELRQNLRDAGFTDVEIEMFLARYELDHHRPLDEDEIQHVLRQLEGKGEDTKDGNTRYSSSDYISQQVYQQELEALDQRVTAMEVAISNVIHKIDTMISKMERGR